MRHRAGTALLLSYTRGAALNSPPDYLESEFIDWKIGAIGGKPSQFFNVAPNWIDPIHEGHQHARSGL